MRYVFKPIPSSKVLNNFSDTEDYSQENVLTDEDMDAIEASFDADEYNYYFACQDKGNELIF